MSRSEGVIWCDGCGIEITWGPIIRVVRQPCLKRETQHQDELEESLPVRLYLCDYCCLECFQGLPCSCGERMELEDERRSDQGSPTISNPYYA